MLGLLEFLFLMLHVIPWGLADEARLTGLAESYYLSRTDPWRL